MCGVCGFIDLQRDTSGPERAAVLEAMLSSLAHRGPDQRGAHLDHQVALGQTRLSIIDLQTGQQPLSNEDGTIWLVFNGEIYNYRELRAELVSRGHVFKTATDGETLLHLYEEEGAEFLSRLNGMFAFALWDAAERRLLLARDRFGMKPLHYCTVDGVLVFASEIKAILRYPGFQRAVDLEALDRFLTYEYVPAPRSIFRGVQKLGSGEVLSYTSRGTEVRRYWSPRYEPDGRPRTLADCAEQLQYLLGRAVKARLVSDVPVGLLLSGGLDSTAILYFMKKYYPGELQTFSIGFDERSYDELAFARSVSRHFGAKNTSAVFRHRDFAETFQEVVTRTDEPLGDASMTPTLFLSRMTGASVKVALGGDGADELLGGYPTYLAHRLMDLYDRVPPLVHQRILSPLIQRLPVGDKNFSLDFCANLFAQGYRLDPIQRHQRWMGSFDHEARRGLLGDGIAEQIRRDKGSGERFAWLKRMNLPSAAAAQIMDFSQYLQDDILVKMDRASMLASLEVRAPFLDNDLVDFSWSLPLTMKSRGLRGKLILRRAMAGKLPSAIFTRSKKGFGIPLAGWIKKDPTRALVTDLPRSRMVRDGYLNRQSIEALIEDHQSGRRNNRKQIYTLLSLTSWYEQHMVRG